MILMSWYLRIDVFTRKKYGGKINHSNSFLSIFSFIPSSTSESHKRSCFDLFIDHWDVVFHSFGRTRNWENQKFGFNIFRSKISSQIISCIIRYELIELISQMAQINEMRSAFEFVKSTCTQPPTSEMNMVEFTPTNYKIARTR